MTCDIVEGQGLITADGRGPRGGNGRRGAGLHLEGRVGIRGTWEDLPGSGK